MADDSRSGAILGRISSPPEDPRAPASSVDVLLVHGDAAASHRITGLLRRNRYTVLHAADATAATGAVRAGCVPRLVLVDPQGLSPADLAMLAALQAEPPCSAAPFLVLSRSGAVAVPGLNPAATLIVPIEAAELVEAVRRFCGTLGG